MYPNKYTLIGNRLLNVVFINKAIDSAGLYWNQIYESVGNCYTVSSLIW